MEKGINEYLSDLLEDHLIKNKPLRSFAITLYERKTHLKRYHRAGTFCNFFYFNLHVAEISWFSV